MTSSRCNYSLEGPAAGRLPASLAAAAWLALLAGCSDERDGAALGKSPAAEAPILVRLGSFERGEVTDKVSVSADLEAISRADVLPELPGTIRAVLRRQGDLVKRGDPVVQLVEEPLQLAVEQKRIAAAQAKVKVQQAEVASREGAQMVEQRNLLLEKARGEYDRMQTLFADPQSGLVSKEDLETKRYAFEQARIDHAMTGLLSEKHKLDHALAEEAHHLVAVELRTAEYNLSQATLRSPIDGAITYLLLKPGEMLGTGTRAFSVVDARRLEARLHVPQKELARLRVGLPVRILCEVFPDKVFTGTIEVVNPVVDRTSGMVEVIVGVTDPSGFLRAGLFVNAEIILDARPAAVLVPKKAVSYENQEPIVFLVKDRKQAHRFVLEPGYASRTHIEVLGLEGRDGLRLAPEELIDARDWALVEVGHNNLKDGSPVTVFTIPEGTGDRPAAEAAPAASAGS